MTDLKPCPFCGSEKISVYPQTCRQTDPERAGDRAFPMARCGKCFAEVGGENFPDRFGEVESAIKNWNTRAPDPRVQALVDALRDMLAVSDVLHKSMIAGYHSSSGNRAYEIMEATARAALKQWEDGE